jgi:hypothetical protein
MPRVSIASVNEAPTIDLAGSAVRPVETSALFARDCDPIHLHVHRLRAGASLRFTSAATDHLIYVWTGTAVAEDTELGPRSTAIVEYGASLTMAGGSEGAVLVEFNMQRRTPSARGGGHIHLLPQDCVPRVDVNEGKRVGMALHADSLCPTCQVWLHENDYADADVETAVHSHSAHEVIFVRAGEIRLGHRLHGPGTALAIAADTKYGFRSGPHGLSLVNFRGAPSTYVSADGSVVLDEVELWKNHVNKPEYRTFKSG